MHDRYRASLFRATPGALLLAASSEPVNQTRAFANRLLVRADFGDDTVLYDDGDLAGYLK
ncbi:MAG TPA: hypothetical protein VIW94_02020 [Acidimicrobiia bacterium]